MQKTQFKNEYKIKRIGTSPYFKDSFLASEKQKLETYTNIEVLEPSTSNNQFENLPKIVITNTHNKLSSDCLTLFSEVELIVHANSGYDNFNFDFVKNFKGTIILGNEIRAHAVANYICSATYQHYSPINFVSSWDKERKWNRKTLAEINALIIGHGLIGSLVSKALDQQVNSLDIHDPYKNLNIFPSDKKYDLIIIACSCNQLNHHMINLQTLNQLASDGLIINTSRGELINTNDLITFLNFNPKASAVLDVFEKEPFDQNDFQDIKNLNKTSHIAGVYSNIDDATISFSSKVIHDFLNSEIDFNEKYKNIILKNRIFNNFII